MMKAAFKDALMKRRMKKMSPDDASSSPLEIEIDLGHPGSDSGQMMEGEGSATPLTMETDDEMDPNNAVEKDLAPGKPAQMSAGSQMNPKGGMDANLNSTPDASSSLDAKASMIAKNAPFGNTPADMDPEQATMIKTILEGMHPEELDALMKKQTNLSMKDRVKQAAGKMMKQG